MRLSVLLAALLVFATITLLFSPMIWLATLLAPLPPLVMFLIFQPVAHMNLVEGQKNKED
ncbi:MAG: hypothetical protein NZM25_03445 [Leptospiraceae bacterium]|nr:hypothetical protein [Leptospiraceae bacterium]MDW8306039.1 hypothetical protein [Leptospiraceae bacterium]